MFEKRIESPEDAAQYIQEVDIDFVLDGKIADIDDDAAVIPLDEDYDVKHAYTFDHGMKGDSEVIPGNRAAFVTPYNGPYVPSEHGGYAVIVPVRGTFSERRRQEYYEQPTRFRFYRAGELDVPENPTIEAFCFSAVTRAIYDVASGTGLSADESSTRIQEMDHAAQARRLAAVKEEAASADIESEMHKLCPEIKDLEGELFANRSTSLKEIEHIISRYLALRREYRPIAIQSLSSRP